MDHITWYIGCSGYYYREWKELFYPKGLVQSKWFEFYASKFNTLEINNTFYKFPQLSNLQNWYQKAPEGFKFSVKVPGAITHFKQFNDTETLMSDFYAVVKEGLQEKLGCILFQLPPKVNYSAEKLEIILKQINPFFQNVIEFRHNSWWRKEVLQILENQNITFCGVSYPGIINDPITIGKIAYYRFHGVPKLYHSTYASEFLKSISDRMLNSGIETGYIYFNNTASAAALENAAEIKKMLGVSLLT